MNRDFGIQALQDKGNVWEVLVIGGGASGLGTALEAASRGYKTLLIEQSDFTQATSSRSTKLIHGGVRYLRQGNFALVRSALKERGIIYRNAPHLVNELSFIIPIYNSLEGFYYRFGLKLFDWFAGKLGFTKSSWINRDQVIERLPTVSTNRLKGGVVYSDGQFDDARFGIALAQTIYDHGGIALNYVRAERFIYGSDGRVCGVEAVDLESGRNYEIQTESVINATGIFSDSIRRLDDSSKPPALALSQGAHIVLPKEFLPGTDAMMVPETTDGRLMFAIPWHNRVIVGTTDTAVNEALIEPKPFAREIEFILENASRYFQTPPEKKDILSVFAGIRPLVIKKRGGKISNLSRDHSIEVAKSGMISVLGGKWTTYRRMGQDVIDMVEVYKQWSLRESKTANLRLHGWVEPYSSEAGQDVYGSDRDEINILVKEFPEWGKPIDERLSITRLEVVWAVREEMARTVEDVLARRSRSLFLDAGASIQISPLIGKIMAKELGANMAWEQRSVENFKRLARNYLPDSCFD